MGIRLTIIKLGRYNKIGELLMENRTTGLQAQVIYQDKVREASVTRAAVRMGVVEMGMRTGYRGTCNRPPSWDPDQGRLRALQFQFNSNSIPNKSPACRTLYLIVTVMQSFEATYLKQKHKTILEQYFQH